MKRERPSAARAMATAMRVAGDKEGEGGKVMAMVPKVTSKHTAMATNRATATVMRVAGKQRQQRQRWQWQRQ
jgi:hypothetical protein